MNMARLSIQEQRGSKKRSGWKAVVRIDYGPPRPITVTDPFTDEEEEELEWYFEEHLEAPYLNKVRAQDAAASIKTYGEKLFDEVFGEKEMYAEYQALLKGGLSGLHIEIEGSPAFHALHWEAIKDPKFEQPLSLQSAMIRKNLHPQALPASARPSSTINLLIVTARPSLERDVGYRTISRPLVESLRNANLAVQVDILRPGTYKALDNHLRVTTEQHGEGYYHVMHFDMHGTVLTYAQYERIQLQPIGNAHLYKPYGRDPIQPYEGIKAFLAFEPEVDEEETRKKSDLVEATQLAAVLVKHQVPITILNACQSGKQVGERETSLGSHLVRAGVQLVLAMGYSVTVSAAELLMTTLYQRLFAGDDLTVAIRHARTELANDKERLAYFDQKIELEDWLLPVVYQNKPITLQPREFTPDERKDWFERKAEEQRYTPPDPTYGFVGRDLDILHIEKRLLTRRNILLVRGMGGAGKTTLLSHLAVWWHTTGFVRRVFSFGYDEKAWTLQQIMAEIAQTLYGPRYYTDFQPLSLAAQQAMLAQTLRSENHLLLLDNLESITGAHLAIQHTLPQAEQKALQSFLADLAKGRTLILLGSRGSEDWLAKGTFDDNIYDLPGLDKQAASTLAERILLKNNPAKYQQYRQHSDLKQILKLLDGFPLALEVVLANLAHQTPTEVVKALQEGDVRLDLDDSQQQDKNIFEQKTESILRCIDYSHSNLSQEAQQLLLCLAPFTSLIWIMQPVLNDYIEKLRQQPALSSLPFERWSEVMQEALNWGLLGPEPNIPHFLRLQPIFPYFLRNRLHAPKQAEVRKAVETAFREHYELIGSTVFDLLTDKEPHGRQIGQMLADLEYENLSTALKLSLMAQVSILKLYSVLSSYLDTTQDQRRGMELGQSVLTLLESYTPEKLAGPIGVEFVSVIDSIAMRQLFLKQYIEAEVSYQRALALLLENKGYSTDRIKELSAVIYHQLGAVEHEQRKFQQAEQYYQQSLEIFIEFGDRERQANTYHQLGLMAQEQRHWLQAEQYYLQALKLKIELNDRYEQASTYHQLGIVAQLQQDLHQAEQYYQQALEIFIEFDYRYGQANTYIQLGSLVQEQQAEQYYQQALEIFIEFGDRDGQANTYHHLGFIAQEQRHWLQAEQYYLQALKLKIELNDHYGQASSYGQLGKLANEKGKTREACDYFLRALEIFVEYKDDYHIGRTLYNLALLWQTSSDANLLASVAPILGTTVEETKVRLLKMLKNK
jgi:tetratricopeptide (TPR) repeat protein